MWLRSGQHARQRGSERVVVGLDLALYSAFVTAFCALTEYSNLCMTPTRIRDWLLQRSFGLHNYSQGK